MDENKKINKTVCIACSIFRNELDEFISKNELKLDVEYLTSMLHMNPELLEIKLLEKKEKLQKKYNKILLLFGDCCPNMLTIEKEKQVCRTDGINCIEIVLGKEKYEKLRRDGVFFLMPEWTLRWKEVFKHELKLKSDVVKEFMQEFHTKIIYIDTGQMEVPLEVLDEIHHYTGLKVEIMKSNNEVLKKAIEKKMKPYN